MFDIGRIFRKANPSPSDDAQAAATDIQLGRPERPISGPSEDRLTREPFIRRLTTALIDPRTKKATGVVIGITGQWGAGKSSLLNLLRKHIEKEHSDAVVVAFDPWLVSGRDDLITQFLAELISALKPEGTGSRKMKNLAKVLNEYGDTLAPLDVFVPGAGVGGKAGLALLNRALNGSESLLGLKRRLEGLLANLDVPIVVLIDELDRVEDHEIRSVAQLVRSIADFPGISYVLAYDPKRVIQALGEGASQDERERRGSAYLEKIVQLQVPLPVIFGEELIQLLNAELERLPKGQGLPDQFQRIERYQKLTTALLAGALQTPRDVSRLVGTFHALIGMVGAEVDAIDLLGYSALLAKSPRTVQRLLSDPDNFSDDILSERSILRRMGEPKTTPEERLKAILPEDSDPGAAELLKYLFPVFADRYGSDRATHSDRISLRRPLLTVLRLGLIPGTYTVAEIEKLLTSSSQEVTEVFRVASRADNVPALLDRIMDVYPSFESARHIDFWKGAAAFVRKPDCNWLSVYSPMHDVIRELSAILPRAIRQNPKLLDIAPKIFTNLRGDDDVLTAVWLRDHIFFHGLFGRSNGRERGPFLNKAQTEALVRDFSKEMRSKHLNGMLLPCRYDLQPVYTMMDTGEWDNICVQKLQIALENDAALDGFTLLLYGPGYASERDTIDKLCTYELFHRRVEERVAASDFPALHESVQNALLKAKDPFF